MPGVLFDNIDLKDMCGFVVNEDSERDTAELETVEIRLYDGQNGAHIHDNGYKTRFLKLSGTIYASSVSLLRSNLNLLKRLLSTARKVTKPVIFPDEPDRVYHCFVAGRFIEGRVRESPVHNALHMNFGVNLKMPEPFSIGAQKEYLLTGDGEVENPGAVEVEASAILYGNTTQETGYVESVGWHSQDGFSEFGISLENSGACFYGSELHKIDDVCDEMTEAGILTRRIKRVQKITDGAGQFTLTGFLAGSNCIVIRSDGSSQKLEAGSTVSTGWAAETITVLYVLATEESESHTPFVISGSNRLYPSQLFVEPGNNSVSAGTNLTYELVFTPKYI